MSKLLQRSVQYASVTLTSVLAATLLFVVSAPATTSETRTDGGVIPAAASDVQTFTATGDYTLAPITRDVIQEKVPNYGVIRIKAIAYAHKQLDSLFASADVTFAAQQRISLKTLAKQLKTVKGKSAKAKVSAQIVKKQQAVKPTVKQWTCLDDLWTSESGWQVYAVNVKSGAYGIAQALPAEKMESTGGNWADSYKTQITWGLQYINDRYTTPCNAWKQWQQRAPHWY